MKHLYAVYLRLLDVIPGGARRFLAWYAIALGALAIVDALSLGLLAIVIGPLVAGTSVTLPVVGTLDEFGLLTALAVVCILVIVKGVASLFLLRSATRRFARYERQIGARLFRGFLRQPWTQRLRRHSADVVRLTDTAVAFAISSFLLPGAGLVGELMSFVAVALVLAVAQPMVAVITLVYLGGIAAVLYFWIARRAREAGRANLEHSLNTARLITEIVGAQKEVMLRGKTDEVESVVDTVRDRATRARSSVQFLTQIPRYVLESSIIGGFVIVGAAGYLLGGLPQALTAIALFGLAGFRIAPSLVRFQSTLSMMTAQAPNVVAVLDAIDELEVSVLEQPIADAAALPAHPVVLRTRDLSVAYGPQSPMVLDGVDLTIPFGTSAAIVGASGAGKSTLVDALLGLLAPTRGTIEVDDVDIRTALGEWRHRIGYVPQEVSLFDATVAQNVALTWREDFDRERVSRALARAQVLDVVEARDGGVDRLVGERGLSLSGGQRQRIGIARALYEDPLVLVMDEATSALDGETEAAVSAAIRALHGSTTVIMVAHRLSTIKHADQILFMKGGRIAARGTFDELVAAEPEFARQAELAGLTGGDWDAGRAG